MADYLYTIPNATSGLDSIAVQTITAVPAFTPLVLFFVYFVVTLGGITRQIARTGTADYAMWSTLGGMSAFIVALLFSVSSGFINSTYLIVTFLVTILSGIWFFLENKSGEV